MRPGATSKEVALLLPLCPESGTAHSRCSISMYRIGVSLSDIFFLRRSSPLPFYFPQQQEGEHRAVQRSPAPFHLLKMAGRSSTGVICLVQSALQQSLFVGCSVLFCVLKNWPRCASPAFHPAGWDFHETLGTRGFDL